MSQRVMALTRYFWRRTLVSLSGVLYIIVTLAFWYLFFDPGQGSTNPAYYVLIIGAFGAAATFLLTLSVASRGNLAEHYPLVVRLPSRVEYLTAVFLAAVLLGFTLQGGVALLALYRGPDAIVGLWLEAIPVWTAVNILAAVLALHASDLVTMGWSRVVVYGTIALLLMSQYQTTSGSGWLVETSARLGRTLLGEGYQGIGQWLLSFSQWLTGETLARISDILSYAFWPFAAFTDAIVEGYYDPMQAMAPAVLLLYATLLFLLAADIFTSKDLDFTE